MKKHGILALFCALGLAACQSGAPTASQNTAVSADTVQTSHLKETKFSLDDLLGWTFNGIGQVYKVGCGTGGEAHLLKQICRDLQFAILIYLQQNFCNLQIYHPFRIKVPVTALETETECD